MEFAGESWGLTRIVARCMARNPASARVMEKAGLLREGHLQAHIRKNGRYEDVLLYGLSHASRREG
jgi:RimJ/RimL family protein N-acetyltransferase